MSTHFVTASGTGSTKASIEGVFSRALSGLPETQTKVNFGLIFGTPGQDLKEALAIAKACCPEADFVASGITTTFTERGVAPDGIVVALVAGDELYHRTGRSVTIGNNPDDGGKQLAAEFADGANEARRRGLAASVTILLIDGFAPIEAVVEATRRNTRSFQLIVGGGVGDATSVPKPTAVGLNGTVTMNGAIALHVFSKKGWGIGVAHGMTPVTPRFTVTKSEGNVIQELEHRPAFAVYEQFARSRGVELTPEAAPMFLIQHELGLCFFDDVHKVRVPFGAGPNGSLICGGVIPEQSQVAIMKGEPKELVRAARGAAAEAFNALNDARPAGVLVFSCVCRGMILGKTYGEEIDAIREVFPGIPIAGFQSCGEIARYKGRLDGVHNATVVVVAVPE